jgi:hypothetical protein
MRSNLRFPLLFTLAYTCFLATADAQTFQPGGLVAAQSIDWNGYNISVDSFDSGDTNKSTTGFYDPLKAGDRGDVFTNGSLTNSVPAGAVRIFGHVHIGGQSNVQIGNQGAIGDHTWQAGHTGIEPGWLSQDAAFILPDVSFPSTSGWLTPLSGSSIAITNCTDGTNCYTTYEDFDYILDNGDYFLPSPLHGRILVAGNARLALPAGINMAGNDSVLILPSGSLLLYAGGSSSTIGGNGIINQTRTARACQLRFTPVTTSLNFSSNGEFIGMLMAPKATIRLLGGGSSANDFIGSITANSIVFNGNFNLHFDEAPLEPLLQLGPPFWSADGHFSFTVLGSPGSSYVIEATSNLSDWTSVATNTSPFTFVDNTAANFPQRYYRARLP